MRNLLAALVCLTLTTFAWGQTSSGNSTSAQHANTEKSVQGATQPKDLTAIIETTAGNITCTLFPDQAPLTVANFIGLATGTKAWKDPKTGKMMQGVPLYNGTIFHRVIPNFMIQGGDPVGNGSGDPGYSFKDEFSPSLTFDQPGRLAMANNAPPQRQTHDLRTVPGPQFGEKDRAHGGRSSQRSAIRPAQDHRHQDHRPASSRNEAGNRGPPAGGGEARDSAKPIACRGGCKELRRGSPRVAPESSFSRSTRAPDG